jgi:hypothetical protein
MTETESATMPIPSSSPAAASTAPASPRESAPPVPTMIPIRAFRTPVRGYAFAAPPPGGVPPESGVAAELAREPDNPADPLAVAVWASPERGARWRIGYLDRGVAARVAPRLDAGTRVRAQLDGWSTEPQGRWRRPLVLLLPEDPDDLLPTSGAAASEEPAGSPDSTAPAAARARLQDTVATPGLWGRPPGVRRRRVS